jgi:hypothetical protein
LETEVIEKKERASKTAEPIGPVVLLPGLGTVASTLIFPGSVYPRVMAAHSRSFGSVFDVLGAVCGTRPRRRNANNHLRTIDARYVGQITEAVVEFAELYE